MRGAFASLLFCFSTLTLFGAEKFPCSIKMLDGRVIHSAAIVQFENGDLEFIDPVSNLKTRVARGKYRSAYVPKPAAVTEADASFKAGDFKKAADSYAKADDAASFLGWHAYCVRMRAEALLKIKGEGGTAEKLLESFASVTDGVSHDSDVFKAYNLLAGIRAAKGDFNGASALYSRVMAGRNDEAASTAFLRKGDLLYSAGKKQDASLMFFQAALLFSKSAVREEALYKTCVTLRELNDRRSEKFANILRSEFPEGAFTKKLAGPPAEVKRP